MNPFFCLPFVALMASEPSSPQVDVKMLHADMKKWTDTAQHAHYERPPREVRALLDSCGAYLLAVKPPPLGWAVTGAVLERTADSAVFAMSSFDHNVILFPQLTPGLYRLRVIRLGPSHFGALTAPDYMVSFLGRTVQIEARKVRPDCVQAKMAVFGYDAQILAVRDPELERAAWTRFHRKYGDSTWAATIGASADSIESVLTAPRDSSSAH